MKTEVREFCGKTAENGEIQGSSAGSALPGKACECPTRNALEILDELTYGHEAMIHQALSAPCPCAAVRESPAFQAGALWAQRQYHDNEQRLRARVETLEADKARLDWLEKSLKARSWRFASWLCRGEYAAPEVVSAPVGDKWPEGVTQATARAAIDAARGALKEGK